MEKLDYELLARKIVEAIQLDIEHLVQRQLKETAFQLTLFAEEMEDESKARRPVPMRKVSL